MRLHLKNLGPEVHALIVRHKAKHSHKNLDETVSCLLRLADKLCFTDEETEIIYAGIHDYGGSPDEALIKIVLSIEDKLASIAALKGSD